MSQFQQGFAVGSSVRVTWDFDAVESGELSVRAGDILTVLPGPTGDDVSEGWLLVSSARGASGFVPRDYVTSITDSGASKDFFATASTPYGTVTGVTPGMPALAYTRPGGALSPVSDVIPTASALASVDTGNVPNVANLSADYAHLFASHEQWFKAASAKRQETYRNLQAEAMDLVRALTEAESRSSSLLSRISDLESLIASERGKWASKQTNNALTAGTPSA